MPSCPFCETSCTTDCPFYAYLPMRDDSGEGVVPVCDAKFLSWIRILNSPGSDAT